MNRDTFFNLLNVQAVNTPDATALYSTKCSVTWGELLDAIHQRVDWIERHQIKRLGLLADNSVNWILWDLAALFSNTVLVPIPGYFSLQQKQHALEQAAIECLLSDKETVASELGLDIAKENIMGTDLSQCDYFVFQIKSETHAAHLIHEKTAKITFTSGSTGEPKGVMLSAENMLNVANSLAKSLRETQVKKHDCILPLATLLENIAGVYAPFLVGATVQVSAMSEIGIEGASDLDVALFVNGLHQRAGESLILLPQLLLALVSSIELGAAVPSGLKFIAVGGARVSETLLRKAEHLGLPVYQGYGLSENGSVCCLNTPESSLLGSVGRPLSHNQIRISLKGNSQGDPQGEVQGEIQVKGNQMLGYLGGKKTSDEWLSTGDIGYLNTEGFLFIKGRKKNVFITSFGRNVNPEWVESELCAAHEIAQAIVCGEAKATNTAIIFPRISRSDQQSGKQQITNQQLQQAIDQVNTRLPDYARVKHWIRADTSFSFENGFATSNGRPKRQNILNFFGAQMSALDEHASQAQTTLIQEY